MPATCLESIISPFLQKNFAFLRVSAPLRWMFLF